MFFVVLLMFALQAANAERPVSEACPMEVLDYYTHVEFHVLNDTCYVFVLSEDSIYDDAKEKCQEHNGTLAMPKSMEVNDFLVAAMRAIAQEVIAWIGINDQETEGKMVYEDGSSVELNNFDWSTHGFGGKKEDCVALNSLDSRWHDYPCEERSVLRFSWSDPKKPFICEYRVEMEFTEDEEDQENDEDKVNDEDSKKDKDNKKDEEKDNKKDEGKDKKKDEEKDNKKDEVKDNKKDEEKDKKKDEVKDKQKDKCPSVDCRDKDCGMNGFKLDENGCQLCECQE